MRKLVLYVLLAVCGLALPKLYHWATAGFSPKKVVCRTSFNSEFASSPPSPEIFRILRQPFYYLGQGRQVFVFESRDKQHVLKLVRFNHYQLPFFKDLLQALKIRPWSEYATRKKHYRLFFSSYKMSLEKLSPWTGVVFVHLNPTTALMPFVTIYDRLHRPHHIFLDDCAFLLQKKALPLTAIAKEDVKKAIDSFFDVILAYKRLSVAHYDLPNIIRNGGFYQGRYVEMDVGSYEIRPEDDKFWYRELFAIEKKFLPFLKQKAPEEITYFEKKKEQLLKQL